MSLPASKHILIGGAALLVVLVLAVTQRRAIFNMMIAVDDATLANKNVQAFLKMIRIGEGTSDALGYQRIYGSRSGAQFVDFSDHPRRSVTAAGITSTAAGAYQILRGTWDELVSKYGFADFSPHSQDLAAVALLKRRGALLDVMEGRFDAAISKCAKEWASLPGSPYGQPTVKLADARSNYQRFGGVIA
ncbi:MAG TPA: glycoside hydrolase family 104 protein [Sideroxyarcus sp.]|nr:glycoside hydrolase family 104 protein [Sideroxyarcus sp.]